MSGSKKKCQILCLNQGGLLTTCPSNSLWWGADLGICLCSSIQCAPGDEGEHEVTIQINPARQGYFWFPVLTSVKSLWTFPFLPELRLQDTWKGTRNTGPAFLSPCIFFLGEKLIHHYDEHCFSKILVEFFLVEKIDLKTGIKVLGSYTAHSHFVNLLKEYNEVSITQLIFKCREKSIENVHLLTYFFICYCFIVLT